MTKYQYNCPHCGTLLTETGEIYFCENCGKKFRQKQPQPIQTQEGEEISTDQKPRKRLFFAVGGIAGVATAAAVVLVFSISFARGKDEQGEQRTYSYHTAMETADIEDLKPVTPTPLERPVIATPSPSANKNVPPSAAPKEPEETVESPSPTQTTQPLPQEEEKQLAVAETIQPLPTETPATKETPTPQAIILAKAAGKMNVPGTNIWYDSYTTRAELNDVIASYNMIPTNIRGILTKYNVPIYLVGNSPAITAAKKLQVSTGKSTDYATALQLFPWLSQVPNAMNRFYVYNGYLIEYDSTDLSNVMFIKDGGKNYVLSHGILHDVPNTSQETLQKYQNLYLSLSADFGANLAAQMDKEAPPQATSIVRAESQGPTCVYDDKNNYNFMYVQDPGYVEYYANALVYSPDTVIHEVGHVLDWYAVPISGRYTGSLSGLSSSGQWQSIYSANKDRLAAFDVIAATNVPLSAHEGFAEAFRLCITNPTQMAANFPDVYGYVMGAINRF